MKRDTFTDRLKKAMNIRNATQKELADKTGLSKSRISQYVNGTYLAKQDGVYLLSKALNVNEAWLMGYYCPMERCKPETKNKQIETDKRKQLFDEIKEQYGQTACDAFLLYAQLDSDDQGEIRGEMKQMLKHEKYSVKEDYKHA